jgi:hypothetical protein
MGIKNKHNHMKIKTKANKKTTANVRDSKNKKSTGRVTIPVIQMTERGRKIKKFKSICEASAITGVNTGSISKVVRGICQTAGGFRWANA